VDEPDASFTDGVERHIDEVGLGRQLDSGIGEPDSVGENIPCGVLVNPVAEGGDELGLEQVMGKKLFARQVRPHLVPEKGELATLRDHPTWPTGETKPNRRPIRE